jgi:C4-dicarboxylate-specific signal transduction histidine kinase
VNRLIAEVAEVMRTDLMLRQVHLELQLAETLPRVRGDSVELQQVLLNLLVNGAEALASRPVHKRTLIIGTTASANAVEIIVRDFGLGVAPSDLPRLFEPFFTTKPAGLGMGLAICAEIVRSHGGILAAENAPDGGLLVRCRLPPSNPVS